MGRTVGVTSLRVLSVVALIPALAGCSAGAAEAQTAAVAFFKAAPTQACAMRVGMSDAQATQCASDAATQSVHPKPYADDDYFVFPYPLTTQKRGDGYAVLIEAVRNDGTTFREVVGTVRQRGAWRVDASGSADAEEPADLCAYIGGDCR